MRFGRRPEWFCLPVLAVLCAGRIVAQQHDMAGMEMAVSSSAALNIKDDPAAQVLTVRLGPLDLPARTDHMHAAQPAPQYLAMPFDGWIRAYHPRLVDNRGKRVPGRLLHHVAFYNTARPDFLCPNKQEHIFGAGGELNDWPATQGYGYAVKRGDRIRITSMFHNPTETSYPQVYLEVRLEYTRAESAAVPLRSVYPAWLDVKGCGDSSYDLPPGPNVTSGEVTVNHSGVLLGVGGHMHDYGRELLLKNVTRQETVAKLPAKLDAQGHILSLPVVLFMNEGGYRVVRGDHMQVTATYDNPTGHILKDGAMGIVVGYFLPENDREFAQLHRPD